MTSNIIRKLLDAVPFRNFTVHTADGKALTVTHPETAILTQGGRMLIVNSHEDDVDWIDVFLIRRVSGGDSEQPA